MLFEKARNAIRGGDTLAETPPQGPETDLGEVFESSFSEMRKAWNTNAEYVTKDEAYRKRIKAVFDATGEKRDNPLMEMDIAPDGKRANAEDEFQTWLEELSEKHPEQRDVIRSDFPIGKEAAEITRASEERAASVYARAPDGVGSLAARLGGGFAGLATDPLNLASLAAGPFGRVGVGAAQMMWQAAKVGAINAGVEIASFPIVKQWREKAGLEFTPRQLAEHVGIAFAFGFGLDAGVRGTFRAGQKVVGREPILDAQGKVKGYERPTASADAPTTPPPRPEQALELVANDAEPGSLLARAQAGETAALDEIAKATGVDQQPAVRGARMAIGMEDGLADLDPPMVERFDHLERLSQAIRHSIEPEAEPPPVHAEPVPPAKEGLVPDGAEVAKQSFSVDGKPVRLTGFKPEAITSDAATFQFKGGADAAGMTDRLAGVTKWDDIAAGRVVVLERANGERIIADGHQRLALAKRLAGEGQDIEMQAFVFKEADGWTPQDVRALAAKKNLQEGSGSIVDAAKIMRERPDIVDQSVPLSSEAMRQARSLTRLSDEAFDSVVAGVLPANHAAMIGDLVPDKSLHEGMLSELVRAQPSNAREARFVVNDLMTAPVHTEEQMTLLGASTMTRPLLRERAKVADMALKQLKADKRIFKMLNDEAGRIQGAGNQLAVDTNIARALNSESVASLIEQLAAVRSNVSDWLNDAARAVGDGMSPRAAAEQFTKRVSEALERDGINGLAGQEAPRPRGLDEVNGAEAKTQVEGLEVDLFGTGAKRDLPPGPGTDVVDLGGWLQRFGIDPTQFGKGQAKTLKNLADEINAGESRLVIEDGKVFREVEALALDVFIEHEGQVLKLIEEQQVFTDGRTRVRANLPSSLGEKITLGSDPAESIPRALDEELGVARFEQMEPLWSQAQEVNTGTFPGITTRSNLHRAPIKLDSSEFKPTYVENQAEKSVHFKWLTRQERAARAKQFMENDPAYLKSTIPKPGNDTSKTKGYLGDDGLVSDAWKAKREFTAPNGEKIGNWPKAVEWLVDQAEGRVKGGVARDNKAVIIIGHGGAGKSQTVKRMGKMRAVHASADDAKLINPDYEGGANTGGVHTESVDMGEDALVEFMRRGNNIILEKIGKSNESIRKVREMFNEAGYEVELVHVDVPVEVARERAIGRFFNEGRGIQSDLYDKDIGKVFDTMKEEGGFVGTGKVTWVDPDGWRITQNTRALEGVGFFGLPGEKPGILGRVGGRGVDAGDFESRQKTAAGERGNGADLQKAAQALERTAQDLDGTADGGAVLRELDQSKKEEALSVIVKGCRT